MDKQIIVPAEHVGNRFEAPIWHLKRTRRASVSALKMNYSQKVKIRDRLGLS